MALKVMKVVVQKTGKKTAAPKKSAAASMTELSEWAKEKSGDEMDLGSDADDVMKKPSSSATMKKPSAAGAESFRRRDRNKDYHFVKQLNSMPKPVIELWKNGKASEKTAMVNLLMEPKARGNYEPNFSKPQFQDQPSVLIIIMCVHVYVAQTRIT